MEFSDEAEGIEIDFCSGRVVLLIGGLFALTVDVSELIKTEEYAEGLVGV